MAPGRSPEPPAIRRELLARRRRGGGGRAAACRREPDAGAGPQPAGSGVQDKLLSAINDGEFSC